MRHSDSQLFDTDYETLTPEHRDEIVARLTKTLLRWSRIRGDDTIPNPHADNAGEIQAPPKGSE